MHFIIIPVSRLAQSLCTAATSGLVDHRCCLHRGPHLPARQGSKMRGIGGMLTAGHVMARGIHIP